LSVRKRAAQKFDIKRFNLENVNNVAGKELCQVKISNRFAALKYLDDDDDDDVDINRTWESIKVCMKASATESLDYCDLK
jgi:predicted glutamine amidotransferase